MPLRFASDRAPHQPTSGAAGAITNIGYTMLLCGNPDPVPGCRSLCKADYESSCILLPNKKNMLLNSC
jgi:hypothetical protein